MPQYGKHVDLKQAPLQKDLNGQHGRLLGRLHGSKATRRTNWCQDIFNGRQQVSGKVVGGVSSTPLTDTFVCSF